MFHKISTEMDMETLKKLFMRNYYHLRPEGCSTLINNMDHMSISGTEPSSVILNHKKNFQKLKRDVPNVPKETGAKNDGVINPQNYTFKQF